MKKYNFCAGPSMLPPSVLEKAAAAIMDYDGSGLSLLEISHRSDIWAAAMDELRSLMRELMQIPDDYEVFFMQGGASSQFYMAPANLSDQSDTVGYIDTGIWSSKAIKEAKRYAQVQVVASSDDERYTYVPTDVDISSDLRYLHITSNNTIYGSQYHQPPKTDVPIIADMSSDILGRPIDVRSYSMIYAGAQKNIGTAGVTAVIIDREFLARHQKDVPTMMSYSLCVEKKSMVNTPPVMALYVSLLTLRWLRDQGGSSIMEKRNAQKAKLLYSTIDESKLFTAPVRANDRSMMNVVFHMDSVDHEDAFLAMCEDAGCVALRGHRTAGGLRASIYNAMPMAGVELLCELIKDYDQRHA